MLPVQASALLGLPTGGATALRAPDSGAAAAPSGERVNGPVDPDAVARPGAPSSRLDLRTQTQAQSTAEEPDPESEEARSAPSESTENKTADGEAVDESGLTEAERRQVEKLKERDRKVREHERAHASTGGSITGSPSFKFTQGPDGKRYAVSGEVSVDTSPVSGNPEATIRKMELVARAALAPSDPSGQDRRVAASARAAITKARQEIAEVEREELAEKSTAPDSGETNQIGDSAPTFDPEKRFRPAAGGASGPLGAGLAGSGGLDLNIEVLSPGALFNLIA